MNTTIAIHTITSPNTTINPAPPTPIASIVTAISVINVIARMINSIIINSSYSFSHNITCNIRENYIERISKHVSHRFLGIGFIFKAHIICLIVTVGYKPSLHLPALLSKNALKFVTSTKI